MLKTSVLSVNPITHGDVRKRREPHDHAENCPRHVCECDKEFVRKMLNNHHICLEDANSPYCLNDEYRHTSGNIFHLKKIKKRKVFEI